MAVTRSEGIRMTWSTLASALVVFAAVWAFVKPVIADALADDITVIVQQEVAPLNSAFVILLRTDIANMRREIAQLEFRRDNPPEGDWSSQDASRLVNLQLDLASSSQALKALENA